jgi:hypothetical protein
MRSAVHSHAALLLAGTALVAILAAVALNALFQPSLPPSVNAIEIGEPRDDMDRRDAAEPQRVADQERPSSQREPRRPSRSRDAPAAPAPVPAPSAPPAEDDGAGED